MKASRVFGLCLAIAVAVMLVLSLALADDKTGVPSTKPAGAPVATPPNPEEGMKRAQAYATPGAGHKALEPLVGEWDVSARFWTGGPDGPANESKGVAKTRWILGGRYLQEEFSGEMMQQPFQGIGTTAYDNLKQKYLSTWIDSMGTGMFISEGTLDDSRKVLTFLGKMDEPMTGEKDKPTKYIIRILSDDKHTMEMHDLSLGEKSKVFEMTYTRKR